MKNNYRTIALLTGRGNNTLKDKNILDVLGNPVMYYPANAGIKANVIDDFYCSSDDEKILLTAEKIGYKRIKRPLELATPTSQHIDCIKHGLKIMEEEGDIPDILVVILANNVTIKSKWINDCVDLMKKDMSATAVVPVYEDNDHHPLRAKKLNSDGTLSMYEDNVSGNVSTNRQDLPNCFFLSHNFWVLNVKNILGDGVGQPPWSFMGNKIVPYEIHESIDIHNLEDLHHARKWIRENYED